MSTASSVYFNTASTSHERMSITWETSLKIYFNHIHQEHLEVINYGRILSYWSSSTVNLRLQENSGNIFIIVNFILFVYLATGNFEFYK